MTAVFSCCGNKHSVAGSESGMSLRDYFAARAPMPIPEWYRWMATTPRPHAPAVDHLSTEERADASLMLSKDAPAVMKTTPRVTDYVVAMRAANAWRDEQRRQKFFAWRYYYADMMIAERAK